MPNLGFQSIPFQLFQLVLEYVLRKELLQPLVGVVYAQLFEAVVVEYLEAEYVQDADAAVICSIDLQLVVDPLN